MKPAGMQNYKYKIKIKLQERKFKLKGEIPEKIVRKYLKFIHGKKWEYSTKNDYTELLNSDIHNLLKNNAMCTLVVEKSKSAILII